MMSLSCQDYYKKNVRSILIFARLRSYQTITGLGFWMLDTSSISSTESSVLVKVLVTNLSNKVVNPIRKYQHQYQKYKHYQ